VARAGGVGRAVRRRHPAGLAPPGDARALRARPARLLPALHRPPGDLLAGGRPARSRRCFRPTAGQGSRSPAPPDRPWRW
jgi:hypothetical protein